MLKYYCVFGGTVDSLMHVHQTQGLWADPGFVSFGGMKFGGGILKRSVLLHIFTPFRIHSRSIVYQSPLYCMLKLMRQCFNYKGQIGAFLPHLKVATVSHRICVHFSFYSSWLDCSLKCRLKSTPVCCAWCKSHTHLRAIQKCWQFPQTEINFSRMRKCAKWNQFFWSLLLNFMMHNAFQVTIRQQEEQWWYKII